MAFCFGLASCGGTPAESPPGAPESSTPTPIQTEDVKDKILETSNWVVGEIWNNGFILIRDYADSGKDPTGADIDIDFAMEAFEDSMLKKQEYDDFIQGLQGEEYDKLKQYWDKLSPEIDSLYTTYKDNPLTANDSDYPLNTDLFVQYRNAFSDEANNIYSK